MLQFPIELYEMFNFVSCTPVTQLSQWVKSPNAIKIAPGMNSDKNLISLSQGKQKRSYCSPTVIYGPV